MICIFGLGLRLGRLIGVGLQVLYGLLEHCGSHDHENGHVHGDGGDPVLLVLLVFVYRRLKTQLIR